MPPSSIIPKTIIAIFTPVEGFRNQEQLAIDRLGKLTPTHSVALDVSIYVLKPERRVHIPEASLRRIDAAIVDVSLPSEIILYFLGILKGFERPVLLVKSKDSFEDSEVPTFINDTVYEYTKPDTLIDEISDNLRPLIYQVNEIKAQTANHAYLKAIWFGEDPSHIHIVGPSEAIKTEYAYPTNPNYIYMHNFGDNDTIVETNAFLKMLYPKAKLFRHPSDNFAPNLYEENLLVIGGPGELETEGNIVCRRMMEKYESQIKYPDGKDAMVYLDREFEPVFNSEGYLTKDYGYFARLPNPFNKDKSVVLISGIHTFGVLGSAKILSDHPNSRTNIEHLIQKLLPTSDLAFEIFFEVQVIAGEVLCPEIDASRILPIKFV